MNNFIPLHCHSIYSLLDGMARPSDMAKRAKELGMSAIALTDHNHVAGIPVFVEACKKEGIKPIIGCEMYYTPDMKEASKPIDERKKDATEKALKAGALTEEDIKKKKKSELKDIIAPYMYDMHQYHIIFLAKNQKGWNNLVKLQSEAAELCTYNGRFLCDMKLIEKYSEGLICTTACVGGYVGKCIEKDQYDEAEDYIVEMKRIFGEDFYLEIQPLDMELQYKTNIFAVFMAGKHDIKMVATNDSHYVYKEDFEDHDTLLCIGTGAKKSDPTRMRYTHDFWIKSYPEMLDSFDEQIKGMLKNGIISKDLEASMMDSFMSALNETNKVAEKIEDNIVLGSDKPLFPNTEVPEGHTPESWLTYLSYKGMYAYLKKHPDYDRKQYEKQLNMELEIICKKGFAPYMLTVREYTTWANENGCATGPGRGSAAGSLCLFSIGITKNIDPIQNRLLFSRFLTADRKDPPDVDLDFAWSRRDDVIHHLEDYYGKDHVAHIGTFSELGVKSGIKDICRVLEVPFTESNELTKAIDEINSEPGVEFKTLDAMKDGEPSEQEAWKRFDELEKKYPEIFRLARRFEGIPRNQGVHASGVLVTPVPVTDLFPVRYKDGTAIALYTGPQLESFNAIKLDILGLKNLDVITKTIDYIDGMDSIEDLYEAAKIDDEKTWKLISAKKTEGVFQIESNMMKGIIERIQPSCFDDLGVINAIGRPGPISIGLDKKYADVKNGKEAISYPIRGCEDILDETFGNPVYQEQLMFISKKISGFDDMQADSITRKVLGKKKVAMFPMMKRCHVFGKKNCEGPEGWENDDNAPWYDPKGKYGKEIPGALVNGYTKEEVLNYFDQIEGFAKYCFNRAHSACYAYIGFLTAWLKTHYPTQFMAAVLSMAADEKKPLYVEASEKMGIKIAVPDINISGADFTPDAKNNRILYGIGAVKGVGDKAVPEILAAQPFASLEDAIERIPKKAFNKKIAENLIQAGAFDSINTNRYAMLNELHRLRKDKGTEECPEDKFDSETIIFMEEETLGTPITYKPWWKTIKENEKIDAVGRIVSVGERFDKKGRPMAFPQVEINNCKISGIMFASKYVKHAIMINDYSDNLDYAFEFLGKKDEKGTLIINDIKLIKLEDAA